MKTDIDLIKKRMNNLTTYENKQLIIYKQKWIDISLNTDKLSAVDEVRVNELMNEIYKQHDYPKAPTVLMDSPAACLNFINSVNSDCTNIKELINDPSKINTDTEKHHEPSGHGQHDAYWLSLFDFALNVLKIDKVDQRTIGLIELACLVNFWYAHEGVCLVSRKPIASNVNDEMELHCTTGPAVEYADGFKIYALDGDTLDFEEWQKKSKGFIK